MVKPTLSIETDPLGVNGEVLVHRGRGQMQIETAAAVERAFGWHADPKVRRVLFDLSAVEYVSSTGWGMILADLRGLRDKGGDLRICGMSGAVRQAYELLQFQTILVAYPNREEGLAAWSREPSAGPGSKSAGKGDASEVEEQRRGREKRS